MKVILKKKLNYLLLPDCICWQSCSSPSAHWHWHWNSEDNVGTLL